MKSFFIAVIPGLVTVSCLAQGTVTFQNGHVTFPTIVNRYVYAFGPPGPGDATDAARRLTGSNYCAGLWYVPGAGNGGQLAGGHGGMQALNSIATSSSLFNFTRPFSEFPPGTWVPAVGNSFVLAGVTQGQSATLQVRVWDWVSYGRSEAGYLAAVAGGGQAGWSAPFDYTVPAAGSTPDNYYMDNLRAFTIPEPSTIVLSALGAANLMLWRRRKRG